MATGSDGRRWIAGLTALSFLLASCGEAAKKRFLEGLDAPANVKAVLGEKNVTVSWDPVLGATGYKIHYDRQKNSRKGKELSIGDSPVDVGNVSRVLIEKLKSNTTYYFEVSGHAIEGDGPASDAIEVTLIEVTISPAVPKNLKARLGSGSVALSWEPSEAAASYRLHYGSKQGGPYDGNEAKEGSSPVSVAALSVTLTGLSNGKTYFFAVAAQNSIGESTPSAEISGTPRAELPDAPTAPDVPGQPVQPPPGPPPGEPGKPPVQPEPQPPPPPPGAPAAPSSLTASATSASEVKLTWKDNSTDESAFVVERKSGTGIYAAVKETGANISTFTDPDLTASTYYTYRVAAKNTAGLSAYSNESSLTTPGPPAAPSDLVATALSSTQIKLTWKDNSTNEAAFAVERKTGTGSYSAISTLAADSTTHTDSGLTAGTAYTYRLNASNSNGTSGFSNEASATPQATPAPPSGGYACDANTIALYHFEETSGTTAADSCGANHGAVTGATLNQTGRIGRAYSYNGVDNVVKVPNSINPGGGSMLTVEAWFKLNASPTNAAFIVNKGDDLGSTYGLYVLPTNQVRFFFTASDNSAQPLVTSATAVANASWHHAAATYDGTNLRLFLDTRLEATTTISKTLGPLTLPLQIGAKDHDENGTAETFFLNGSIDEVRISDKARSASELCDSNTVAFYHFEETSGTTAVDTCGGNNGTINGAGLNQTGKMGQAYSYDGSDDYVDLPGSALSNLTSGTVEAWARLNATSIDYNLIFKARTDGNWDFRIQYSSALKTWGAIWNSPGSGQNNWMPTNSMSDTGWHHLAVTWDGTQWKMYQDGVLGFTVVDSYGVSSSNTTVRIGRNTQNANEPLNGSVDEVRISKKALTPDEFNLIK